MRVVISTDLMGHFEQEEKEKELAKSLEAAACDKRIVEAANSRIISDSLSSYTCKEDLVGLARTLQIIDFGDKSGTQRSNSTSSRQPP